MKLSFPVIFSSIIVLIAATVIIMSARLPTASLWKGYNIVYVPAEIEEAAVLQVFEEAGIKEVISLSKQQIPLVSTYAPVQSIVSPEYSYVHQRNNYFFDRSRQMKLYYIPHKFVERSTRVLNLLQDYPNGKNAGIEGRASYPWIVFFIATLSFGILVLVAKSKIFMLVSGIFPLLFIYCIPSYHGAAATVLLLYGFFLCCPVWQRKDMLKVVLNNSLIRLFCLAGIPVMFIVSWREGVLFLIALLGALCTCYLLSQYSSSKSRGFFVPVPIRSAQFISIISSVASFTLFIPAVVAAILAITLFFFGYFPADTSISGLFLPAPARYTDTMSFNPSSFQENVQQSYLGEELPSLVHYIDWVWDTLTYPYRSLHEPDTLQLVSMDEKVMLPSYKVGEDGVIQEEFTQMYHLNEAFISSVLEGIRGDGFQVETILKTQNCFTPVEYRRMGDFLSVGTQGQLFVLVSLLVTMLISLMAGILIWRIKK